MRRILIGLLIAALGAGLSPRTAPEEPAKKGGPRQADHPGRGVGLTPRSA